MSLEAESKLITDELSVIRDILLSTVNLTPSFDVLNSDVLPYGLKTHTRSISWIVEQVIIQCAKANSEQLGLNEVNIEIEDASSYDCILVKNGTNFLVNVKCFDIHKKRSRKDIFALESFYNEYSSKPDYRLSYFCIGLEFDNYTVHLRADFNYVFSPQFLPEPIYLNHANKKIQEYYDHQPFFRERGTFLKILEPKYSALMESKSKDNPQEVN